MNLDDVRRWLLPRVTHDELYMFFMQMAAYSGAGQSWKQAFDALELQTTNERLLEAIRDIRKSLGRGESLSTAFRPHDIFPNFCVQAIAAGEESATLDEAFTEIATHLEQTGDIERKLASALLPVKIVGSLILVAVTIMFSIVIPRFSELYKDLQIELPLITKIVVGVIGFILDYWFLLVGIGFFILWGVRKFKERERMKYDSLFLKIPLYKTVYFYMMQYRFAKIYQLVQMAGIGPVEALEITAAAMDNAVYAKALRQAAQSVRRRGIEVSRALQEQNKEKLLDPMVINFIATSEQTGGDGKLLVRAGMYYQKVLQTAIQRFSERVGPVFLSPMMFLIVLVLMSVYYPIFTLTQAIK